MFFWGLFFKDGSLGVVEERGAELSTRRTHHAIGVNPAREVGEDHAPSGPAVSGLEDARREFIAPSRRTHATASRGGRGGRGGESARGVVLSTVEVHVVLGRFLVDLCCVRSE